MKTGYDGGHVVDLSLQFPEESKYTADHQSVLVRDLRTRLAALPGVAAITSARAPDDDARPESRRLAQWRTTIGAGIVHATLYYTWVQANYFQTLGIPLCIGPRLSIAGQPTRARRRPQRIGCPAALARAEPDRPQPAPGYRASNSTTTVSFFPTDPLGR